MYIVYNKFIYVAVCLLVIYCQMMKHLSCLALKRLLVVLVLRWRSGLAQVISPGGPQRAIHCSVDKWLVLQF